jgi:hypothetical protein
MREESVRGEPSRTAKIREMGELALNAMLAACRPVRHSQQHFRAQVSLYQPA